MKPNIVLIICDGLRPSDLSLYGYHEENDKNIKKIASESIVFEDNFTSSNASDSSVTSLFSGQNPETSGFIHQHPYMRKDELDKLKKNKFWLPLYLQDKGYKTISTTPLHLWFKKGFDFYMTKESRGQNKFLNKSFVKRFLLLLPNWAYRLGKKLIKARASPQFYSSKEVIDLAMRKIEECDKPFFVFMHLVDTHYPYPAAEIRQIKGEENINKIMKKIKNSKQKEYIKKRFGDINAKTIEQIIKKRDESIKKVDKDIGRLHYFLKEKGLWDNTIFILTSDHGDNFGEHDIYLCRGGLFDSSVKTPLIISLSKSAFGGQRIKELTQNIDIAPTIVDLVDGKEIRIDGKSLIRLIKTRKKIRDEIKIIDSYAERRHAIRTKSKKKVITERGGKCFLCGGEHHKEKEEYDLATNPEELEDS